MYCSEIDTILFGILLHPLDNFMSPIPQCNRFLDLQPFVAPTCTLEKSNVTFTIGIVNIDPISRFSELDTPTMTGRGSIFTDTKLHHS